jgi:hypothetical protein
MAQTIKLKRSATSGAVPTTSALELGEMAINTHDGKAYIKKDDGTESVIEIGKTYSAGTGISLSGNEFSLTDTNAKLNLSGGTLTGGLTGTTAAFDSIYLNSNDRIYGGTSYRAMEASPTGAQLQLGEGYGLINMFKTQNAVSELKLWNNRQDVGNIGVSKVSGYNGVEVANMTFYRGNGGSSGFVRFQVKPTNDDVLADQFQIGDGTTAGYGVNVPIGGYRIGGTTVIDSSRNLTNIGTLNGGTAWRSNNDGSGSGLDADTLDGYQSSYFATQGNLGAYLRSNADDTMSEKLTFSQTGAATYMQNPGGVTFSSVNSGDGTIVLRNLSEGIRFEDENNWDYNKWAGIKYDSSATTMYVGGPASSVFTSNSNPPSIDVNFVGLNSSGLKKDGNVVWHAGNDGSGSGLDADLLDGQQGSYYAPASHVHSYMPTSFLDSASITFTVGGDADTYYPVSIEGGGKFAFQMYSISRHYSATAPSTWNTASHKGGLTFTWQYSGDGFWGGNDHDIRIIKFHENYSTMVMGMAGSVGGGGTNSGVVVWLRGGTASYTFHGPKGSTGDVNVHLTSVTASNGTVFAPRSFNASTRDGEINPKYPIRSSSALYDNNNRVWSTGNDGSGSGLDADTLDGYQSGYFATQGNLGNYYLASNPNGYTNDQTAAEILTAIKTVDGSGSGLDADTLDSIQASSFVRSDANDTKSGNLVLQTAGAVTNSTTGLLFESGGSYTDGRYRTRFRKQDVGGGIPLYIDQSGSTANSYTAQARFGTYSGNNYEFEVYGDINATGNLYDGGNAVWHTGNDGSGSGLDADLLDGQHGSYYAPASHNHSGVYLPIGGKAADSELLDGIDSTGFVKQLADGTSPNYQTPSSRRVDPTTSNPTNAHHAISTFGNGGNVTGQLATHFQSGQAYTRGYNSAWSAWRLQWDSVNDGSGSGLDADTLDGYQSSYFATQGNLGAYLQKSGGTMTGQITLSGTSPQMKFNDTDGGDCWIHVNSNRFYILPDRDSSGGWETPYALELNWSNNTAQAFGNNIWTAGNDGSGSGLDADLLDGQQGSYYYSAANLPPKIKAGGTGPSTENLNSIANSVSTGQLEYRGFNSSSSNSPPVNDNANGVITVGQHSGNYNAQLAFSSNGNMYWRDNPGSSFGSWRTVWDSGNDGSGSGLDADTLDGYQSSYFATQGNLGNYYLASNPNGYTNDQTAAEILTAIKTVDGSGSGLDADLFDGANSSRFIYGDGAQKSTSVNTFQAQPSGFFFYSAATGAPTSEWYNWITARGNSWGNGGEYSFQLANSFWNKKLYFQHVQTGSYQGWAEVWTSSTDGAGSGLDADTLDGYQSSYFATQGNLGAYLQKAGGTMTGALTAPTLYLNNTNTRLHEGDGNALRITTSTGYIDIGSQNSGWIHFQGNKPYYFNQPLNMDADLKPYNTSGARNLGTTANVWNHVYAKGYFIDSTEVIDSNRQIIANKSSATTSDSEATIISKGTVDTTTGYQPQNWHITFQDGGGTVRGKITSSHYATQYSTSSDYRLKEDIQPIANATERLLAIKAVNFKWINGQQRSDGFIAHELQEHLPEAVTGEKDATTEVTETIVADDGTETEVTTTVPEMQGIDQSKLVPLLVKTIQELEARISALENA